MTTDRLTLILSKSSKYPHVSCRCLDEWDVFLDAVNRKAISEELLRFCLRNPDKQFIFISPQGACDLKSIDYNYSSVSVTEIKKS